MQMVDVPQGLLAQLTANQWISAAVAFAIAVIGLAKFTDALKNLHDLWKSVWATFKGSNSPGAEYKSEFDALRRNVLFCGITNDVPVQLNKLRTFLVDKGLVERPEFRRFFDRWLSSPFISLGVPVANAFTYEQIRQMEEELSDLQL